MPLSQFRDALSQSPDVEPTLQFPGLRNIVHAGLRAHLFDDPQALLPRRQGKRSPCPRPSPAGLADTMSWFWLRVGHWGPGIEDTATGPAAAEHLATDFTVSQAKGVRRQPARRENQARCGPGLERERTSASEPSSGCVVLFSVSCAGLGAPLLKSIVAKSSRSHPLETLPGIEKARQPPDDTFQRGSVTAMSVAIRPLAS